MAGVTYRAKAACIVGGVFRRAGDTFTIPRLKTVPAHLEIVSEQAAETSAGGDEGKSPKKNAARTRGVTVKEESRVTAADMGIGEAASSADMTSADMLQ